MTTDEVSVEWLLWVRRLGGAKVAFDPEHPNHKAVAGLVGPDAKSDEEMPAYLDQLIATYGPLLHEDCGYPLRDHAEFKLPGNRCVIEVPDHEDETDCLDPARCHAHRWLVDS